MPSDLEWPNSAWQSLKGGLVSGSTASLQTQGVGIIRPRQNFWDPYTCLQIYIKVGRGNLLQGP